VVTVHAAGQLAAPVVYPIGRAASLAGVSVRTLHHYDQIGLLRASARSRTGYRVYGEGDLARLAQIRYYRELGFSLDDVARVLDDPAADERTHLLRQRRLLGDRIDHLARMAAAVDKALEADHMDLAITAEERLEVFGDFRPEDHRAEAEQRWGGEDAYAKSNRRAASYSKDEWLMIKDEGGAISQALVSLMVDGEPATGSAAMELAERHRQHLGRWFYDCPPAMHRGLGQMYVDDERFTASLDEAGVGLAAYMREAFVANAERLEGGSARG